MVSNITYDPIQHQDLQKALKTIGDSFDDVVRELKSLEKATSGSIEGKTRDALDATFNSLMKKLQDEQKSWKQVQDNATMLANKLKEADEQAKKVVQ